MRLLKWDNMGVKIDGRQLHYCRFADDFVFITPSISHAERMVVGFNKACGKTALEMDLKKDVHEERIDFACSIHAQRNEYVGVFQLHVTSSGNQRNKLAPELNRRIRRITTARGAFRSIEDVVKKTNNTRICAYLFDLAIIPVLTYESQT
ncbi:unnamed protein product [Angiostrongylus costaricensis]|uniref:Reverse transcriptase domain-containing protein n=1 Tax=Angiostrongylus costaricensis TaxID=334426 RepID=A0A0R3PMV4_ANGCS|nr:unnamed protein product [Angiostrongylus costaricensis]